MDMQEIWKPVIGYEALYAVSSHGRVRHVKFNRMKKLTPNRDGYLSVGLSKGGQAKTHLVHRLVLSAFIGESSDEAMHLDHCRTNNCISNLAWGTRAENEAQKTAAGRRPRWTKLTLEQVELARRERKLGKTLKEIGELLGTHLANVSLILKGKTWRT
jgi:NUMOD4 motif/HNH endonuclease